MSIPKFAIDQPVLVNLLMLLIVVAGVTTFSTISKEEWSEVAINTIKIETVYRGASPEEIEKLITKPLEEELMELDDVESIASFSSEGFSVINVNFTQEVDDMFRKMQEVQNEVNKADDLPEDAETPEISRVSPPFRLITVALTGGGMEKVLGEIAQDLAYDLQNIYGVYEVNIIGKREREVWVEIDPARMEGFGLSLPDVVRALRSKNLNVPAGTMSQGTSEFIVRTVGELARVGEFEDIVISDSPNGGHVYVRDIARVRDTFAERKFISHINGEPAILLNVQQDNFGNIADIVAKIKKITGSYRAQLPDGAELTLANDNSLNLTRRLGILYSNAISGLLLVLLSLYFFIGARPAILTAIGIPVAFCAAILLMDLSGITINSISLFALIIVLGLIVDDAIIVCENVYRYIEAGMPVRDAALVGAQEVFWPVTAAILTTFAAFLPMLMMTGPIGKFMSTVPKVVCFALGASLWEAFFVLPSHLADYARPTSTKKNHGSTSRWFQALLNMYSKMLAFAMRRRYKVALGLVGAFIITFALAFGTLEFILFPNQNFDTIMVSIAAPDSLTLDVTEQATLDAIRTIETLPAGEVLAITSTTGRKLASLGFKEGGNDVGSNFAEIEIRLSYDGDRDRTGQEILDDLRQRLKKLPLAAYYTTKTQNIGPPVGRDVLVRIKGDEFTVLSEIARKVKADLAQIPGITDIEDDFRPGKDELRVVVDEDRAALYGLTVQDIATTVQYAYMGGIATEFNSRNEEFDVVVKLDERFRHSTADILEIKVKNKDGVHIPLKNVAEIRRTGGYGKIRRFDQRRVINVTANTIDEVTTPTIAQKAIAEKIGGFMDQYPGYTLSFGGEFEDTQRSMSSLFRSFGLAIFLIYMILATMFRSFIQPVMLMLTIPFAILGVFVGLVVTQTPMGMMSFLGVIALAGIVVNDSIVLISFINSRCAEAAAGDRYAPIIEACRIRLRPIMLTQITTILGLLPLAFGIFGHEVLMTPMAIAIVWGLVFSSVLTLLAIPCFYLITEDIKNFSARLFARSDNQPAQSV